MIEFRRNNLLAADAEALVNSVNTVGVMGKGVALQFKKKFPGNFKEYERACKHDEVEVGKMFTVELDSLTNPRYIINFPTKKHWRGASRLEYVEQGLEALVSEIRRLDLNSIAIPPLGCGNGGLSWEHEVRPLIEEVLLQVPEVKAYVYEPSEEAKPTTLEAEGERPSLTNLRATMIQLVGAYKASHYRLGRTVAQKLAYFAQAAGEETFGLKFEAHRYGPYAENLNFVLQKLEGHYITGYGDRSGGSDIELLPNAEEEARDYLRDHPDTEENIEHVSRLIEGFETPYGLELLATVHWAATEREETSLEEVTRTVQSWSRRKEHLFSEDHISIAWQHLKEEGWLSVNTAVSNA
ncbi:type II toxin-antitoxin system antitoxin DNA ADP-ribosyl glycohydrolase DarG [Rubrobacter aplysinae]|uniref:type II toxin-antitoxin system antitoxin DNA ADP-ribosyl glycohydrolase DarG n=1 Tax=Rubrobacter aplysinae TaxID=909625 RepID=UPI00064BD135|nr:macro domain-containing protein [Rubrobacter aplysinae]